MTEMPTIYKPSERAPDEGPETNRYGQFKIKCPDGKARWYTRCTTYIKCLDDRSLLEAWKQRVVLTGLVADRGLVAELMTTDPLDKQAMNKLVDRAFTAGDGYLKADTGTDRHRVAELWDTGREMPPAGSVEREWLLSYAWACRAAGIEHLCRERRVVVDRIKVTGTPDSVCAYRCRDGIERNVILDLKTKPGELSWGLGEMSQQLAVYAEGELYTDDGSPTGLREPLPEVSRDVGLILHVAQDNSLPPALYEVDLSMGGHGVALSGKVRAWRNYSRKVFTPVPLS